MATSSFFYGGSSAPEQNTVDSLIDALTKATAAADEDRVDAEQAAQQATAAAVNASVYEQNAYLQVQQGAALLSSTQSASSAATAAATNSAASASYAAISANAAAISAANAAASASEAAVSAASADASSDIAAAAASNPYVVAIGSDLAGSGWTYDFGLVTDTPDPLGSGTTPGYIETVAENIDDVATVAANISTISTATTAAAAAATSAANALSSENAASASATAAAASASTATTQATSASSSASAASSSASAASTSAINAAASATAAAGSASNATSSASTATSQASAASASATAAQTARIAAEAALDSFDDRYLGAKSSDPSVDNDGNTLLEGALYWNSVSDEFRAWNGTGWQGLTGIPSVSGNSGKFLYTNGTSASWAVVPDPQAATPTDDGLVYGQTPTSLQTGWTASGYWFYTTGFSGGRTFLGQYSGPNIVSSPITSWWTSITGLSVGDPVSITIDGVTKDLGVVTELAPTEGGVVQTSSIAVSNPSGFAMSGASWSDAAKSGTLSSTDYGGNASLGYGSNASNGSKNTAIGFGAGSTITTGSNLTVVGYDAEPSSATATNEATFGNSTTTKTRIWGALAINNQTGTAGQVLTSNGSSTPTWQTPTATGDVVGPASATGNNIALFDGTTGKLIKDSGANLSSYLTSSTAASTYQPIGSYGDASGPASSTDNAIARFDGTTGKLVQDSSTTIDDNGSIYVGGASGGYLTRMMTNPYGSSPQAVIGVGGNGDYQLVVGTPSGIPTVAVRGMLAFSNNTNYGYVDYDLTVHRDSANTLAQRNGTNPQTFRLYNTYTDGSNYERGFIRWNTNVLEIGAEAAGTGTLREYRISSGSFNSIRSEGNAITFESGNNGRRGGFTGPYSTYGVSGLTLVSDSSLLWTNNANWGTGSLDTGLARDSAGVVKITNGSSGLGTLKASTIDIATFDLGVLP